MIFIWFFLQISLILADNKELEYQACVADYSKNVEKALEQNKIPQPQIKVLATVQAKKFCTCMTSVYEEKLKKLSSEKPNLSQDENDKMIEVFFSTKDGVNTISQCSEKAAKETATDEKSVFFEGCVTQGLAQLKQLLDEKNIHFSKKQFMKLNNVVNRPYCECSFKKYQEKMSEFSNLKPQEKNEKVLSFYNSEEGKKEFYSCLNPLVSDFFKSKEYDRLNFSQICEDKSKEVVKKSFEKKNILVDEKNLSKISDSFSNSYCDCCLKKFEEYGNIEGKIKDFLTSAKGKEEVKKCLESTFHEMKK